MKTSPKSNHLRNDLLLVGGLLAAVLIAFVVFKLTLKDGTFVAVSVDGVQTAQYPLSEDRETVITTGKNGEQTNVLVIEDGRAYVRRADCPDKICVGHRPISQVGETIVCLPHKVVICVTGAAS